MSGNKGTLAIPRILSGEVNPSGRLVDTFAYDLSTAPSYANISYTEDFAKRYDHMLFTDHTSDYIHYTAYQEGIYEGYY